MDFTKITEGYNITARYLGNEEWELFFDDRKRIVLSTHNIEELVEQSEDILYNPNTHGRAKELSEEKDSDEEE